MASKILKFDDIYSIYQLVEAYPNKFKDFLEEFVACDNDDRANNSDEKVMKTMFLYFFELMGI